MGVSSNWAPPVVNFSYNHEINLRIENVISIYGQKGIGKSWVAFDFINQLDKKNLLDKVVIIDCQNKKIIEGPEVKEYNKFSEVIKPFLEYNVFDKETEDKQIIYYFDGLDLIDEDDILTFQSLVNECRFSNVTLLISSRNRNNYYNSDLIINCLEDREYYNLEVLNIFTEEKENKKIRRKTFNTEEHFLIMRKYLNDYKL